MSDTSAPLSGGSHLGEYNVVALYERADQARAAMTTLERHGVEAGDIEVFGPGLRLAAIPVTNDEQRDFDMDAVGSMAHRGAAGVAIGAVVGAVIGAAIAAVVSGELMPILAAALGGVVVGGPLGFLYGGFSGLTVNEQWQETFESAGGDVCVAVHSTDEREMRTAVAALRRTAAVRLCTCGRDGQMHDVA